MGKKRGILVFATIAFCACLSACLPSKEERQQAAAWRKGAETIGIKYIEDKYGFTPTVIDSKSMKQDSVVPVVKYEPETVITMSYGGREFFVLANPEDTAAEDVLDNYQSTEIISAFKNYANEELQLSIYDVYMEAGNTVSVPGSDYNLQHNFYHDYFDGKNLEDLLSEHSFRVHLKVLGENDLEMVASISEDSLLSNSKAEVLITSHPGTLEADACEMGSYFDKSIYGNAINILDAVTIKKGTYEEYDFSISQCGNMYYMFPETDVWECELEEMTADFPASYWDYSHYQYREADAVAYVFMDNAMTDVSELYVYYPIDALPGMTDDIENYKMGVSYLKKNSDAYRFERYKGNRIGNYLVFEIDIKNTNDFSMRLLVEKKMIDTVSKEW